MTDHDNIAYLKDLCIGVYYADSNAKYRDQVVEIVDIALTGSHSYGFTKNTSDVDLIVFVKYKEGCRFEPYNLLLGIRYIMGIKHSIYINSIGIFNRLFMGFNLPRYSLINNRMDNYFPDQIDEYIKIRSQDDSWLEGRKRSGLLNTRITQLTKNQPGAK